MKRIFTFSLFTALLAFALTSCVKTANDEQYWMTKERGQVVYSSPTCASYVVQTNRGYTIIRATNIADRPYTGDILYGDLNFYGYSNFYNDTDGTIISGEVVEYGLSYNEAQMSLDYYCY